jgi:hypothetical protein
MMRSELLLIFLPSQQIYHLLTTEYIYFLDADVKSRFFLNIITEIR